MKNKNVSIDRVLASVVNPSAKRQQHEITAARKK
jgi:hypothetical protein